MSSTYMINFKFEWRKTKHKDRVEEKQDDKDVLLFLSPPPTYIWDWDVITNNANLI